MKNTKTVLTEQLRKETNAKKASGIFKFLMFGELSPLSTLKTLGLWACMMLFAIPTMGVPIFLYNEFQDKTFRIKGFELNLGIILTIGYVALEIIVGLIIYHRLNIRNKVIDTDEDYEKDDYDEEDL